jgi:hypothetical protein
MADTEISADTDTEISAETDTETDNFRSLVLSTSHSAKLHGRAIVLCQMKRVERERQVENSKDARNYKKMIF